MATNNNGMSIGHLARVGLIAAAVAATLATLFVLASPGTAGATGVGACTVRGIQPAPVQLDAGGRRVSAGRGTFSCSSARVLNVEVQLWADDALNDDRLVHSTGVFTVSSPKTIRSPFVPCNEDLGGDELYSKVRARIYSDGAFSAWSAWDRSITYSFSC